MSEHGGDERAPDEHAHDEHADAGGNDERVDPVADGGRDRIELPEQIELPRLMDFYELQTAEDTRIHGFYDNLREGDLTTTECRDCGAIHFPPRVVCPECMGDDLEYVELPDRGELFAFSEVRAGAPLGMEDDVPFVIAIVDLGDVQLSARIDDARSDDLEIGDEVELKVLEVGGPADHERVWFRFVPVEG